MASEQYVYVIQMGDSGPVKIGIAMNPNFRLRELQTGNPLPLRLVTTFSGGLALERKLHGWLGAHRMSGEWFQPHADVMAVVAEMVQGVSRTSAKVPTPMWRYERCANCDVVLKDGTASVVRGEGTPSLCPACDEFAALRASGADPFADE